jgi:hypothetical protein
MSAAFMIGTDGAFLGALLSPRPAAAVAEKANTKASAGAMTFLALHKYMGEPSLQ